MKVVSKIFEIVGIMFAGAVAYEYMRRSNEKNAEIEQ